MPKKTIFNSYMRQYFVSIKALPNSASLILDSAEFKARLPENLNFWIEEYEGNKYFLGVNVNNKILNWQESKSLWEYLVDSFNCEIYYSDKIMSKKALDNFIVKSIELELGNNDIAESFYVRNITDFEYKDLEKYVHQITVTHEEGLE